VFDLAGKLIHKELLLSQQQEVYLTSKSNGIYFIKISNGEDLFVEKLVIE